MKRNPILHKNANSPLLNASGEIFQTQVDSDNALLQSQKAELLRLQNMYNDLTTQINKASVNQDTSHLRTKRTQIASILANGQNSIMETELRLKNDLQSLAVQLSKPNYAVQSNTQYSIPSFGIVPTSTAVETKAVSTGGFADAKLAKHDADIMALKTNFNKLIDMGKNHIKDFQSIEKINAIGVKHVHAVKQKHLNATGDAPMTFIGMPMYVAIPLGIVVLGVLSFGVYKIVKK